MIEEDNSTSLESKALTAEHVYALLQKHEMVNSIEFSEIDPSGIPGLQWFAMNQQSDTGESVGIQGDLVITVEEIRGLKHLLEQSRELLGRVITMTDVTARPRQRSPYTPLTKSE